MIGLGSDKNSSFWFTVVISGSNTQVPNLGVSWWRFLLVTCMMVECCHRGPQALQIILGSSSRLSWHLSSISCFGAHSKSGYLVYSASVFTSHNKQHPIPGVMSWQPYWLSSSFHSVSRKHCQYHSFKLSAYHILNNLPFKICDVFDQFKNNARTVFL